jgi:hypothetical protein
VERAEKALEMKDARRMKWMGRAERVGVLFEMEEADDSEME